MELGPKLRATKHGDFGLKRIVAILVLSSALWPGPTRAATRIVLPPGLQQAALLCLGEALRLCPDALKAKDHGISCIRDKRQLLSVPCRGVYDQGVSFLRGGDVHLDLRALQRKLPRPRPPKEEPVPAPGPTVPQG